MWTFFCMLQIQFWFFFCIPMMHQFFYGAHTHRHITELKLIMYSGLFEYIWYRLVTVHLIQFGCLQYQFWWVGCSAFIRFSLPCIIIYLQNFHIFHTFYYTTNQPAILQNIRRKEIDFCIKSAIFNTVLIKFQKLSSFFWCNTPYGSTLVLAMRFCEGILLGFQTLNLSEFLASEFGSPNLEILWYCCSVHKKLIW